MMMLVHSLRHIRIASLTVQAHLRARRPVRLMMTTMTLIHGPTALRLTNGHPIAISTQALANGALLFLPATASPRTMNVAKRL